MGPPPAAAPSVSEPVHEHRSISAGSTRCLEGKLSIIRAVAGKAEKLTVFGWAVAGRFAWHRSIKPGATAGHLILTLPLWHFQIYAGSFTTSLLIFPFSNRETGWQNWTNTLGGLLLEPSGAGHQGMPPFPMQNSSILRYRLGGDRKHGSGWDRQD